METRPYLPSALSHTLGGNMNPQKFIGSTWLWHYEGKLWPVVLCDNSTPPHDFIVSRAEPDDLPVILLGKHKLYVATLADKGPELSHI